MSEFVSVAGGDLDLLTWPSSKLSGKFLTWVYYFSQHLRTIPSQTQTFRGRLLATELN